MKSGLFVVVRKLKSAKKNSRENSRVNEKNLWSASRPKQNLSEQQTQILLNLNFQSLEMATHNYEKERFVAIFVLFELTSK